MKKYMVTFLIILTITLIAGCLGGEDGDIINSSLNGASIQEGYVFIPSNPAVYSMQQSSTKVNISSPSGFQPLSYAYVSLKNTSNITKTDKDGYYKLIIYDRSYFNSSQILTITKNISKDSIVNITSEVYIEKDKNNASYIELGNSSGNYIISRIETADSLTNLTALPQSTDFDSTSDTIRHSNFYNTASDTRTFIRSGGTTVNIVSALTTVYNVASISTQYILFNSIEDLKIAKNKNGDIKIVESSTYSDIKPSTAGTLLPYSTISGAKFNLFGTNEVSAEIKSLNKDISVSAGSFSNCIEIEYSKDSKKDIVYWAPVLGPVKIISFYNGSTAEVYSLSSAKINNVDYPFDTIAPSSVTNLAGTVNDNNYTVLTWTNPTDSDFKGVKIFRKTSGYSSSVTDGINVYDGSSTTFTDSTVSIGNNYYYTAFAYDEVPNYSEPLSGAKTTVSVSASDSSLIASSLDSWKTEIQKGSSASITTIMNEYDSSFMSNLGHDKTAIQGTMEAIINYGTDILLSYTTPTTSGDTGSSTITGQMTYTPENSIADFKYSLKFVLNYSKISGTWKITGQDFIEEDFYPANRSSLNVVISPEFDYKVSTAPTSSFSWTASNIPTADSRNFNIKRFVNSTWYNGTNLTDTSSPVDLSGKFPDTNSGVVYKIKLSALDGADEIGFYIRYLSF